MRPVFALRGGLTLGLAAPEAAAEGRCGAAMDRCPYPTASLQRGLLLLDGDVELGGEGVGFGVPVLKRGARAVFAGEADVVSEGEVPPTITVTYVMDRAERLAGGRSSGRLLVCLDAAREAFALLYRRAPALRRALMAASNGIRRLLDVRTRFELIPAVARIPVTYTLAEDEAGLHVQVDLTGVPAGVTEVVVMNELGAACFDEYVEEGGRAESGRRIGAWNRVGGASAAFGGGPGLVWFAVDRAPDPAVPGARLYHGRETARGRLAWAGFGYTFRPGPPRFAYTVRIGRGDPA